MNKRGLRIAAVVGALVSVGMGSAAWGQVPEVPQVPVPPPPTLPAPPEPPDDAQPVVDATASGAYTACQSAGAVPGAITGAASLASLGLSIVGSYSPVELPGVAVPTEAYAYVGLAQYPCAYTPAPPQVSHCGADRDVDAAVDTVYDETGAGFATIFAPINLPKLGPIVDLAVAVEALAARSAGTELPQSPTGLAYDAMACEDVLGAIGTPGSATIDDLGGPIGVVGVPQSNEVGQPTSATLASAASLPPTITVGGQPGASTETTLAELAAPQPAPAIEMSPVVSKPRWEPWRVVGIALTVLSVLGLAFFIKGNAFSIR